MRMKPVKPKHDLSRISANAKSHNRRFMDNFGHADKIVLLLMIVLFIFDSHYLIWMRLSYEDITESETIGLSQNDTYINYTDLTKTCHPSFKEQFYYHQQIQLLQAAGISLLMILDKQIQTILPLIAAALIQ